MKWLLKHESAAELRHAFRTVTNITAEQRHAFAASAARAGRALSVSGDVAEIRVEGLLTKQPFFLAYLLGYQTTTYTDIIDALASAASNPQVKRAELAIDSPGGEVHGLFETFAALEAFTKPLSAFASCACSAAYAIATKASSIKAATPASEFGSVGVAVDMFVDDHLVQIASTHAPNKRPDVLTDEGKSIVRQELDSLHDLFVEAIARGRKTTKATVNADYGKGGVVLAMDAKRRGMIDSVVTPAGKKRTATASPVTNLPLYLSQRFGGPLLGETEMEFAARFATFMDKFGAIKRSGGTLADYDKLFVDDAPPHTLTRRRDDDLEPKDLGDRVADLMRLPPARKSE